MKRILITGGAGFIGSNFVRHLLSSRDDVKITVLDALTYAGNINNFPDDWENLPSFTFVQGSVCDQSLVNRLIGEHDVIIHFAAESHVAFSLEMMPTFVQTNIVGTQVLCEATLRASNVERFIHISSSESYGSAVTDPMTEEHPLLPCNPYAGTKAAADRLVYSYYGTYGLPMIIVRPFNNYGPYQYLEKVIPLFITNLFEGRPIEIQDGGEQTRDWLSVFDHARALERMIDADINLLRGETINLGTGRDVSINRLAELLKEIIGKPQHPMVTNTCRVGQVRRHISSTDKAERLLGWKATTPFEAGLETTVRWYRDNKSWWNNYPRR